MKSLAAQEGECIQCDVTLRSQLVSVGSSRIAFCVLLGLRNLQFLGKLPRQQLLESIDRVSAPK